MVVHGWLMLFADFSYFCSNFFFILVREAIFLFCVTLFPSESIKYNVPVYFHTNTNKAESKMRYLYITGANDNPIRKKGTLTHTQMFQNKICTKTV